MRQTRHLFTALLLLCSLSEVSAQPNLEAKVERLEQTIRALERRIENLEDPRRQPSAAAAPAVAARAVAAPTTAAGKSNWKNLYRGMPEGEVQKALGTPTRVEPLGAYTFWYYGEPGGRVTFEGRSRIVFAWSEP